MEKWLERNIPTLTEQECLILSEKTVFIAGCGGLGGYLAELSARCGIGGIILCDKDSFEITNMNRQLGCLSSTLSKRKTDIIRARLLSINPALRISVFETELTGQNAACMMSGADAALDGLDSAASRIALAEAASAAGISLVHGAVSGWRAQAAVIPPNSGVMHRLFSGTDNTEKNSCLSFAPAFCASVQISETVKLLLGKPSSLWGRVLFADLEAGIFETITV